MYIQRELASKYIEITTHCHYGLSSKLVVLGEICSKGIFSRRWPARGDVGGTGGIQDTRGSGTVCGVGVERRGHVLLAFRGRWLGRTVAWLGQGRSGVLPLWRGKKAARGRFYFGWHLAGRGREGTENASKSSYRCASQADASANGSAAKRRTGTPQPARGVRGDASPRRDSGLAPRPSSVFFAEHLGVKTLKVAPRCQASALMPALRQRCSSVVL